MNLSSHLQSAKRPMQTRYHDFREFTPFCGKNALRRVKEEPKALRRCTEETQQLFSCLKKWEYDNLRCVDFNNALQRCVSENEAYMNAQLKRLGKRPLGVSEKPSAKPKQAAVNVPNVPKPDEAGQEYTIVSQKNMMTRLSKKLTIPEVNKLFNKYKQPDLGKKPYAVATRLPHQPYWEDHFNKKNTPGHKS